MAEDTVTKKEKKRRRRRMGLFGLGTLVNTIFMLCLVAVVLFVLSGLSLDAPVWLRDRIETQINDAINDGKVEFSALRLNFENGLSPTITMRNIRLTNSGGFGLAQVGTASATLSFNALIRGEIHPKKLQMSGGTISVVREENGKFDLGFGLSAEGGMDNTGNLSEALGKIDALFERPALASIESVQVENTTLVFYDERVGRDWLMSNGRIDLHQTSSSVKLGVGFDVDYGSDKPSTVALSFGTQKGSLRASFGANVEDVAARDLATQVPALAWLGVLDGPISGAMRAEIGDDGLLGVVNGTLEIGQGALRPSDNARAIAFQSGRAYFGFDPAKQKIRFDELSVKTDIGVVVAEGHGYLRELTDGWPNVLLGQFKFLEITANPDGVFAHPISFTGGAVDMRLRLDPFTVDIGQAVIQDGDSTYSAKGVITADNKGWHVALDAKVNEIRAARMIELWPLTAIPKTRLWLDENVLAGRVFNVNGVVRVEPDQKPKLALGFEFDGGKTRFLRQMPPVNGGAGHGTIAGDVLTVVVNSGHVIAPEGGQMNVAGTVFQIPDIQMKPAPAVITLNAKGPVHAALSLLDQPPLNIMSNAKQPVDLATGRAVVTGDISLPLTKAVPLEQINYDIAAKLFDVRTDKLISGRTLAAAELEVAATPKEVSISGAGTLGRVPIRGSWVQKMGKQYAGRSRVEGTVELSQRFVDEFGIGLPKRSVTGAGLARIEIDLVSGRAPKFHLVSDLNRVGLHLRDIGWRLAKNVKGRLEVSGALGSVPRIDKLTLNGAGLRATGKITLNPNGGLKRAVFSRVRLAGWLDAKVELIGRGIGRTPAVRVNGGTIDIRKTTFGDSGGGGGASSGASMTLALDRLIVSEGIVLTRFNGSFKTAPSINGKFTARVNGKAAIAGTLVPGRHGSLIRIKSSDAGAVFRAAGVVETAYGGSMDLVLVPRKGENGGYDGQLSGKRIKVRGAPALADLLGAISVIGLLEQMNGKGIVFNNYQGKFRLTPTQLIITSSSAVGASLGVSMDGIYDLRNSALNMQGVVSPIYLVNGIGAIFTRRGEGLFGFNYRMTGSADNPKVRVNPLSLLTPGMFRNIFRRPPPKLQP